MLFPLLVRGSTGPILFSADYVSAKVRLCYYAILHLTIPQVILIAAYFATVLACALHAVPLSTNSNRPAFLALAQFPPLFLFSGKASPLALILPPQFSYTRLNFLHRWAARGVLICVTIHGSFWIASDLKWSLPILGQQKETSGIAAYGVLCGIGLASVRVVRERAWIVFHWVQSVIVSSVWQRC